MLEYSYSDICSAWLVADALTGDLLLDDNNYVIEFASVADVLHAHPLAVHQPLMCDA